MTNLRTFSLYDQHCSIYQDGIWRVYKNDQLVIMTASEKEAEEYYGRVMNEVTQGK